MVRASTASIHPSNTDRALAVPEVVLMIFRQFGVHNRNLPLLSCMLVCKRWLPLAEEVLYESMSVSVLLKSIRKTVATVISEVR